MITVGSQSIDFLLDTGATYSVLPEAPEPLLPQSNFMMGLSGQAKLYYFSCPLRCNWDSVLFSQEFQIMPESPSPLLGRDILNNVCASVYINIEPSISLPLIEQNINPRVWADEKTEGQAQNDIPVIVKFKHVHLLLLQKQYPLKPEIKEELTPIIDNLKEQGLLIPCNSPCNTPILGVKKSNDKWRLVQYL